MCHPWWLVVAVSLALLSESLAFTSISWTCPVRQQTINRAQSLIFSSKLDEEESPDSSSTKSDEEEMPKFTSYAEANAILQREDEERKLAQLGKVNDISPGYTDDKAAQLRAVIQARATKLGLEVSQRDEEYIAQKQQELINNPDAAADKYFGGLDLSKINSRRDDKKNEWDKSLPAFLYDPTDYMTKEEQERVDPLMNLSFFEQIKEEYKRVEFPTKNEVSFVVYGSLGVIVFMGLLLFGFENLLYLFFVKIRLLPSEEDMATYIQNLENVELPQQWMDSMNRQELSAVTESISSGAAKLPDL